MNTNEEFQKTLAALETVLAAAVNDDGSPVLSADYDPKQIGGILADHIRMLKACHASMNYMAEAMYKHIYDPLHASTYKNYDHKAYANKVLGFNKEEEIRRVAYANTHSKDKIVVG